jgi:hypothetical protein
METRLLYSNGSIWTHKSNASRSEEDKSDHEGADSTSDMDEDSSLDWDPAVGPGV